MIIRVKTTIKTKTGKLSPGVYNDDDAEFDPAIYQEIEEGRDLYIEVLKKKNTNKQVVKQDTNTDTNMLDEGEGDVETNEEPKAPKKATKTTKKAPKKKVVKKKAE